MQSWLAGIGLDYVMRRIRAGDIRPALLLDARDVTLTFPGDSSWAGVTILPGTLSAMVTVGNSGSYLRL